MKRYKGKLVHTVTQEDVGRNYFYESPCPTCGASTKIRYVTDCCGYFQQIDVGKQLYDQDGVLCIESQGQLERRLAER